MKSKVVLNDTKKSGKLIPWAKKKKGALMIADSYYRLAKKDTTKPAVFYIKRGHALSDCGSFLEFHVDKKTGEKKLSHANFCKVRLCPMCAWRRSLKVFGQVSKIMAVPSIKKNRFIFLTLTQKNVKPEDLKEELTHLFRSFNVFTKRLPIKRMALGWFRALEVTHNLDTTSNAYDTYHPHFHLMIMVKQSYFWNGAHYLTQEAFTQLWKESLNVDYTPQVHIQAVKKQSKAIAETAKYTVKEADLLIKKKDGTVDQNLQDENIKILDEALAHRRLIAFGGEMRKMQRQLKLDDLEKGSLIQTDQKLILDKNLDYIIENYSWNVGYRNYTKINY